MGLVLEEDGVREGDFLVVERGFGFWAVSPTERQGAVVLPYPYYRRFFDLRDTDSAPTDDEWYDFCNTLGFKPATPEPKPQERDLETRLRAWIENMRKDPVLAMFDEPANERQKYVLNELEMMLDAV